MKSNLELYEAICLDEWEASQEEPQPVVLCPACNDVKVDCPWMVCGLCRDSKPEHWVSEADYVRCQTLIAAADQIGRAA